MQKHTIIKQLNGRGTAAFDLIVLLATYHIERPHNHVPCVCSAMYLACRWRTNHVHSELL